MVGFLAFLYLRPLTFVTAVFIQIIWQRSRFLFHFIR